MHPIVDEAGNDHRVDLRQLDGGVVGALRRSKIIDYYFDPVDAQMLSIANGYLGNCEPLRVVEANDGSPICTFRLGGLTDPFYCAGSCMDTGSWISLEDRGNTVVVIGMRVRD